MEWLRKFKSDIPLLEWPYYHNSSDEKSRKEALIQKELEKFEDFWNKQKNSPGIEKIIEEINRGPITR